MLNKRSILRQPSQSVFSGVSDEHASGDMSGDFETHVGRRTVVPAGVSGPEFQLEIAAQSS